MTTKADRRNQKPGRRVPARHVPGYVKPDLKKGPLLAVVAALSKGSVPIPSCWVARAAFGVNDFRWMIFRAWMLEDAPSWFRALYLRRGETVGRWLSPHSHARAVVRAAMKVAIRKKLASAP